MEGISADANVTPYVYILLILNELVFLLTYLLACKTLNCFCKFIHLNTRCLGRKLGRIQLALIKGQNVDSKKDESTGPLKVGDSVFLQRPNAGCGIIIDIDELRNLYTAFFASARQLDSSTTCLICA